MPRPARPIAATTRSRDTGPVAGAVPNAGRRITKAATAISTTMITGFSTSVLVPAAKNAPADEPARAATPIRTARRTSTGALRAYVTAAPDVPTMATALLVPRACAAGVPGGRPRRRAGRRSRPPPPTTASIQPAARAEAQDDDGGQGYVGMSATL